MTSIKFKGFAGAILRGESTGLPEDPAVLLIEGGADWESVAEALVQAGRFVIRVGLGSQSAAGGASSFEAGIENLRAILAQMGSRPVIIAAAHNAWIAAAALGEDNSHLSAGLVLVDPPQSSAALEAPEPDAQRVRESAERLRQPVLMIALAEAPSPLAQVVAGVEVAEIRGEGALIAADRAELFNATLLDFLERRLPRAAPEYRIGSDARTLRDALGCFATGVTIVTAMDEDGAPVGLTANSFTSVSLDPPLLLVCIAKSSNSLKALSAAQQFAVNVLHIGQQPVSNLFAKSGEDRFSQTPWQRGLADVPLIAGALANFECARHEMYDAGDHIILIGKVQRAKFDPRRDPLLYFRGKYRRLHFA